MLGPFHRLRGLFASNVFLLDGGRGDRWLVDTGHRLERAMLMAGLRATGFSPRDLTGVLLTHRHSDHAGNAAYLRRELGLRVHAHALDSAVLAGQAPKPPLVARSGDPLARLFAALENTTRTRVPVDVALEAGVSVAGLEVHHVPGHTEGSVFYRHAATGVLLSGDTLLAAVPPLTIEQRICLPHPDYAVDLDRAIASLRAFHAAGYPYRHLLAGHGRPILGDAREQALALLAAG